MDGESLETNITNDVGVNEDSIMNFAKLSTRMNGERPAGHRHNSDEVTEKLLECICGCLPPLS